MRTRRPMRPMRPVALAALVASAVCAPGLAAAPAQAATGANGAATAPLRPADSKSGRVIEIRPHDVRLLLDGRVVRETWRPAGPLTMSRLARLVAWDNWLSLRDGVATVNTAIYQAPGTTLRLDSDDVDVVRLQQRPEGFGGRVIGSRATLDADGVQIVGWDGVRNRPAAPGELRPYVQYHQGSTVRLTGVQVANLGRDASGVPGLSVIDGRLLQATRTTIRESRTGIASVRTANTSLTRVAARGNTGNGVVVREGGAASLVNVMAQENTANGVLVDHTPDARLDTVRVVGNHGDGVLVRSSTKANVRAVTAEGNLGAGLALDRVTHTAAAKITASTNESVGVAVRQARNVSVRDSSVSDNGRDAGSAAPSGSAAPAQSATASSAAPSTAASTAPATTGATPSATTSATASASGAAAPTASAPPGDDQMGAAPVGGVRIADSSTVLVRDTTTEKNHGNGLDIDSSSGVRAAAVSSTGDTSGVRVRGASVGAQLEDVTVAGATALGIGVAGDGSRLSRATVNHSPVGVEFADRGVAARAHGLQITGSDIGIKVSALNTGLQLAGATVAGSTTAAMDVQGRDVAISGLDVTGGVDGVLVRGAAAGVNIVDSHVREVGTGVRAQSDVQDLQLRGLYVQDAQWGVDSGAARTSVQASVLDAVDGGVTVRNQATVAGVDISASECGVKTVNGTPDIEAGTIRAPRATCGEAVTLASTQVLPPEGPRNLGIFAGAMVLLGLGFEGTRRLREGRRRRDEVQASGAGA